MLLTSWIRALRQSFTRHRWSRVRRKPADARRQDLRHARLAEVLEERTLLSIKPLVIDINALTGTNVFTSTASAPAINITNSLLDPNNDGISDYDDLLIGVSESSTFDRTVISGAGIGIRINLSNLTGLNHIAIDNVFITAGAGQQGISITLDNVALQSLVVDQTTVTPSAGAGGTGLDINLKNMASTLGVDVSIQNSNIRSGNASISGVNVTLESFSKATHVGALTLSDSNVESFSVSTSANSILYAAVDQTSIRNSRIENAAGVARGITYNLNRTTVGDLRIENNLNLRNVAVTTTNSPMNSVSISNNANFNVGGFVATDTIRDAIRINATSTNAVGTQRSDISNLVIQGNTITGNLANNTTVNGIVLNLTDSNLGSYAAANAGARISNNTIQALSSQAAAASAISINASATAAFVAGNLNRPLLLDFDGDGTANDVNGITNNNIVDNNGRGLVVTTQANTRFLADVANNLINGGVAGNRREGMSFSFTDRPSNAAFDSFALDISGNRVTGTRNGGVEIIMANRAIGAFNFHDNEVTQSEGVTADGLSVSLIGTNVTAEATNVLRKSFIENNFIGVTAAGVAGGNIGNGIAISTEEASEIQDLQIRNNRILNNAQNGISFLREDKATLLTVNPEVGQNRAVTISNNTIGTSGLNGILLDVRNGSIDLLDFEIRDNLIGTDSADPNVATDLGNTGDGINLVAQADARMVADITNNQIRFNNGDGIDLNDVFVSFNTDKRQIGGTWLQNTITDNTGNGIFVRGRHGLFDEATAITTPLIIGRTGLGNILQDNGGNGLRVTATGDIGFTGNLVFSNDATGVFVDSNDERIAIRDNQIEANTGKGIDLQARGRFDASIRDNVVTGQINGALDRGDGIEITQFGGAAAIMNVLATNNFIDSNAARGVELINLGSGAMQIHFGDGTLQGRNTVVGNREEGFYVINSTDFTQPQDAVATTAGTTLGVSSNGSALQTPDMMLNVDRNLIQDNGLGLVALGAGAGGSGLIIRAGSASATGAAFSGGDNTFAATYAGEVGANSGVPAAGNGRINMRVTNNEFEGNFGNDFVVDAYISNNQNDPNFQTTGTWDSNIPLFVINRIEHDPLVRVNLVFTGNTGNGIDVTRGIPGFTNNENNFKSRTPNHSPPPSSIFGATRSRSIIRLGGDAIPVAPVVGFSFVFPDNDPSDASTMRVEAGFDRSGTTVGFPFYNPNAPGPGSDDNFDDSTNWSIVPLGTFTYPNVNSPTLLTANVVPFTTPRSSTPGVVQIDFTEYVRNVDITDFRLLRNGVVIPLESAPGVPLAVTPVLASQDPNNPGAFSSFTIDLSVPAATAGNYELRVLAVDPSNPTFSPIEDVVTQFSGQGNILVRVVNGDGVLQNYTVNHFFTVDTTAPTATVGPIAPNPRNSAAGIVTVTFNEAVTGVDIVDFELYRNDGISTLPVNLGSITVVQISASQYTLNLNQLTGAPGTYELRLVSTDSNTPVRDLAGNLVADNVAVGIAASDTWVVDTTLPFVTSIGDMLATTSITSPRNTHPGSVIVNFSEAVSGVDNADFSLLRTNTDGTVAKIDISSSITFPLFQLAPNQYELNLTALATTAGTYTLSVNPLNSGIVDTAGNAFLTTFVASWVLDVAAPLADIADVAPDPRQTPVDALNTIFNEKVNGVNVANASLQYVLSVDDGTSATAGSITNATNASTIVVTSAGHGLTDGTRITIYGVVGNTNANGVFRVQNATTNTFELFDADGAFAVPGNGIYASGGRWVRTVNLGGTVTGATNAGPIVITSVNHGLTTGTRINVADVLGNLAANGVFTITRIDADTFSLNGSTGTGAYTTGGTWVRTTSAGTPLLVQATNTRYVLDLSTVTLNQGTYVVSLLADGSITDDAENAVGAETGKFNVAAQDIWTNGPDAAPTGTITPLTTPRGTNAGIVTVTFSEPLQKIGIASPVDFRDFSLTRGAVVIDLTNVPIKQTGPTTFTLDLSSLTDADGTYTLQLKNGNHATPDTVTPLGDLTGNPLADDSDPSTATGIASQIVWVKDSSLSGPQVTTFVDVQRSNPLGSITKLRAVQTLEINFTEDVQGIDLTNASQNFLLTRQATGGIAIPVSLDEIAVQRVTARQYRIDLSTLTGTDGLYRFTVLANGLITNTAVVPVELKNPQTATWTKDGVMRPSTVGDSVDTNPGNEVVGTGSSYSFRQAIQEANALSGDDIIELGAGTYTLSLAGVQEDFAARGDLDIRENLVIRGKGVGVTIIDATALANQLSSTDRDRLFQIMSGVTVTIQGVTIQNGAVTGSEDGGAIRNSGNLTILDSLIQNSTSQDAAGAIDNTGTLTIDRTTISGNTAVRVGGAIRNVGTLFINNSTLSNNRTTSSSGHGGALMNAATFTATLEGVTISGNTAQSAAGGGIRNDGNLVLINNTIAFNTSLSAGAGISRNLGTVSIGNTIVSDNRLANSNLNDVAGSFNSLGGNIVLTPGTATGFTGPGDQLNTNANLQPLGNNGGPTQTHALPAFSSTGANNPAIDRGLNALVTNQNVNTSTDQRGALRFLDGPNTLNSVDVGAFEFGTFFVNTTDDSIDVNPGDGLAEDGLRQTSLRAAIMESNSLGGESAIMLDGQVYSLKRLSPDTTAPTVTSITGVPLAPITTGGVGVVTITFSERVAGFDLAHVNLTRTVGAVTTPIALLPTAYQLTKVSDLVYRIENLADIAAGVANTGLTSLTQTNGLYNLTINQSAIVTVNGVPTNVNIRDIENLTLRAPANVNWVRGVDTFAPTVSITANSPVVAGGGSDFITNGGTVTVTFSERVTGVTANNFTLTRDPDGAGPSPAVPVTGLVVTPVIDNNFGGRTVVTLNLQTLTAGYGDYVLTLNPIVGANVTIRDTANNNLAGGIPPLTWTKTPALRFEPINDPRVDEVTKVRVQFTERVAGLNLADFTMTFDDGSGLGPQNVNLSQATLAPVGAVTAVPNFGSAAEQWDLTFSNKTAARDGQYVLSFDGLTNGNQLVTTATTATTVVPFAPTTTTLNFQVGEDLSRIGDLDIIVGAGRVQIFGKGKDDSTTVLGNPQSRTVIDGNLTDRIFDLTVGANVSFSGVEMINGRVVYERSGGAIRNLGTVTINDSDVGTTNGSSVQGNFADGNGGAIFNAAPSPAVTASLQAGVGAAAVTLTLNSVAAFPTTVPFTILVDSEQMQVTAVNVGTNQFTVVRGFGGTAPAAHLANATVSLMAARVAITGALQVAATNAAATLTLANVSAFPVNVPFIILVNSEQMQVTAVNAATNQFTVSRGFGGTTPAAHAANAVVTLLSSLTINRSNLQNNLAGSAASGSQFGKGGAIFNESGALTINEGIYSANGAVTDGGAIYNGNAATASLFSTTFTANNAGGHGGAIYNNDTAILSISSSTLNSNRADAVVNGVASDNNGDGGAIYNETSSTLVLDDSLLQNNSARNGGALFNDDGTLVLNRDTFGVNTALQNGGAIYNTAGGRLTLNLGLFTTNSASDNGGAIHNYGTLTVLDVAGSGTQFLSNEAGTDVRSGDSDNGRGGAIFNQDGTVDISASAFTLNRSHGDAGVIFNDGIGSLILRRTTFDRNSSDGNGGVLVNNDFAQATVDEVRFANNSAIGDGGAIYNNSEFTSGSTQSLTIDDSTLNNNKAARGGAIFNTEYGGLTMTNSTLSANVATTNGGGLSNFGFASLLNDTLYLNDAPIGAGIANNIGGAPPFGQATLKNTLVAGGVTGADIADEAVSLGGSSFVDGGHNLIGNIGAVSVFGLVGAPVNGNLVGDGVTPLNPQLDVLRDNGGPTLTHGLLFGSPARDAGDNFAVTLNDQRGLNRVFDGDGNGVATVDIGAFESGFVVNSFLDTVDENPGDGINADASGRSTLRAAIMEANARPGEDTIILGPGIFLLTLTGRGEDFRLNAAGNIVSSAETGDLDILDDLNIIGAGTDLTFIDAAQIDRLFQVFPGVQLKLSNLTLQNGNATSTGFGGAIFNQGTTTLDNVLIVNSSAGRGGGVYNDSVISESLSAVVQVADTTLTVNNIARFATATPYIIRVDNELMLVSAVNTVTSTLSVTRAQAGTVATQHQIGAEVTIPDSGNLTIDDSLFRGNQAVQQGGALYNDGTLELTRSDIGAVSRLAAAISTTVQTTVTVANAADFPTSGSFVIQVDGERMLVTAVLGNTFTVTRGYNGTVATTHTASAFATLGNSANIHGGGLFNLGVAEITQSSFNGNLAQSRGGGLYNAAVTGALTAGINAAQPVITLTSVVGLPTVGSFTIQIDSEQMTVTNVDPLTNTITVTRGVGGTIAAAHVAGTFATTVGVNEATIQQSTFLDNFASSRGAAIYNEESLEIRNSTLANNRSGTNAALGNSVSGQVTIINSTVVDNVAYRGGGLSNSLIGTVRVLNTIVANNASTTISGVKAPNVRGTFSTQGNNFIGNNADSTGFANNTNFDQVGSGTSPFDPVLRALADNGGPTQTYAARTGSPVIDAGNNTGGDPFDQRGAIRPTNSDSDIGAVEQQEVQVTINDVTLREGDTGSTLFTFTLSLNKPSIQEVRVQYSLQGDTAFAGEDFIDAVGEVVFAPNQLNQTLVVVVNGDRTIEADERFLVNLSVAANAAFTPTLVRTQAIGTILSDDTGFRITDVNKVEGETGSPNQNYVFTVSVVGANLLPNQVVTVNYAIVDGTATLGSDYVLVSAATGTFTFTAGPNGQLPAGQTITVAVVGDDAVEGNENFLINLTSTDLPNFEFGKSTGIGTIFNDDLSFTISNATANEGDPVSTVPMNFTVTLDRAVYVTSASGSPVLATTTATVATASGTATTGEDFNALNTVLTFSGLTTSQVVAVGIIGDLRYEVPSETFQLQVAAGTINGIADSNVVAFSTAGTGTIVDNDPAPDQYHIYTYNNTGAGGVVYFRIDRIASGTRNLFFEDAQSSVVSFSLLGDFGAVTTDDLFVVDFNLYDDSNNFTLYDTTGVVDIAHVIGTDNPIPSGGLSVDGLDEVGADTLRFQGGDLVNPVVFDSVVYHSTNPGDGSVDFVVGVTTSTVTYAGLEPVFDNTQAQARVFNAPTGNSNDNITVSASSGFISISGPTFESVTALAPLGSLTLYGHGGNDNFLVTGSTFAATLTIDAGTGDDVVDLSGWGVGATVFGGDGTDSIIGGSGNDSIDGGIGNDTIRGGLGNDTMLGNSGADSLFGGSGDDSILGGDDNDTIVGEDGIDYINGGAGNDSIDGGAGSETLDGGAGDDTVSGGDGNDTVLGGDDNDSLSGGAGADSLDGGFGNDTMSGDAGIDTINGQNGNDVVVIMANANITLFNTHVTIAGVNDDVLIGNSVERARIIGGDGNNILDARNFTLGPVTLVGGLGRDTLYGTTFDDVLDGGISVDFTGLGDPSGTDNILDGGDLLDGGNGRDTLNGRGGDDTILGGAGDDCILGGSGNDTIDAGSGNDNVAGNAGSDSIIGGTGIDTLDGGDGNDTILGGDDGDSLLGGAGQDSIDGGKGDDTIDAGDGNDTVVGGDGNDYVGGGSGEDNLQGNLGDDSVNGNDGNDTLDGNEGFDTLFGGSGDDVLISTDGNDQLNGQGGTDSFTFNGDNTIGDIFTITLAGNGFSPPTGIGLARLNSGMTFTTILLGVEIFTLNLNGGNDLVTLGDLADVLDLTVLNINGGSGNDTIDGSLSTSPAVALRAIMGAGNDSVLGTSANDTVLGEDGNDTIIAGNGDDSLDGGAGNDSLNGNGGDDTIDGGLNEDSIWGGGGADFLTGSDGNDTIWGQAGDDSIDGGNGNDFLDGGYGEPTTTGTGNDTIRGGSGNDKIAGRDGLDSLFGDNDNDTILGGADNDFIDAGNGNDLVQGDAGNDTINGAAGNDFILGGDGDDYVLGGAGNDTLIGEAGKDTLNGQGGRDTVVGGGGFGVGGKVSGEKLIGEKKDENFKITSGRPSIFNELNF